MGVRDRCVLRRPRGRVLRVLQELDVPAGLLLQHLGVHPLHGHPRRHGERLGRARWAPRSSSTSNQEGLANIGAWLNDHLGSTIDVPGYQFGIYGVLIVVIMLFRPQGLLPSARRKRELQYGCTTTAVRRRNARHARLRGGAGNLMAADLLEARQIRKEFGGLVAVNDVDFTIPEGAIVSLIGPNGAGKTTFFNMITGVYKPTAGRIVVRRRGHHGQAAARGHRARDRPDVPEHPPVPGHDRARERARRDALAPDAAGSSAAILGTPGSSARRRRREGRRASCSRTARSRPARTTTRATCPTATSAGSRSRARSPPSRSCCCSTSRPPA